MFQPGGLGALLWGTKPTKDPMAMGLSRLWD